MEKKDGITRIVIIDHDRHEVYFEDITHEQLAEYNGDEQAYINDNYNLENYSWDYINYITYFADDDDKTPYEVVIEKALVEY